MNISKKKRSSTSEALRSSPDTSLPLLARAVGQSVALSVIVGALLSLLAALVAYSNGDPDSLVMPLGLGALALCALVCGFDTRRRAHCSPLLCGLLSGIALLVLLFFFSCFLSDSLVGGWSSGSLWSVRGGVVLFCILGAAMSANAPRAKRGKRKKSHR